MKQSLLTLGLTGILSTLSISAFCQENSYGTICYCTTAGNGSPQSILQMDNNWEIILGARDSAKAEDLNASKSQLKLLTDWRLLVKDGSEYKANIPILDSAATLKLRSYSASYADKIIGNITEDVGEIINYLSKQHRSNNTYTILFSYILDGLIWDEFERQNLVDARNVTAYPLWSGEFWALKPERQQQFGTNSLCDSGLCLKINWNKNSVKLMRIFFTDFKMLSALYGDIADNQIINSLEVKRAFDEFGIFKEDGTLSIPIIEEKEGNFLYEKATEITKKIAKSIANEVPLLQIQKEFGFTSPGQTLVILYHEIMWDILNSFNKMHILTKPPAFDPTLGTNKSMAADLLFVTINKGNN